ncbi:tellurite resistance TerB family protein [Neisseriaceae bacterium ESL0693]|nr:tellurite resistance TerB family protein [Neisseriaceae bacterium ESL0693]
MSFFNSIKETLTSGHNELARQVGRFKNKKFMQGTVAVCAYIAVASNGVSTEEKKKMMDFLKSSEELKVFETEEIIEFFNKLLSHFEFDNEIGKGEAMKYILGLPRPEAAQLALRVGIAVAKSDDDFDVDEQKAVSEIANALGFHPRDFGI